MVTVKPPPKAWGEDSLTAFLEIYRQNQFATFANKKGTVDDLSTIDDLFLKFLHGAINPRPFMLMMFLLRAHAAFRSSAGAVMAGQLYESQALLRLSLEHGAYAFFIGDDCERWKRWMARHDSHHARQLVRKEFSHSRVVEHITAEAPVLARQFEQLYEELIDFGAHPNERGFSINSMLRRDGDNTHIDAIYLQADGLPLELGLKTTGQVGLWILHIAQLIYRVRFELLGIRIELEKLRQRY